MPTSTLAKSVNAVVAVNGDFFTKSTGGFIVRQGETLRKKLSDQGAVPVGGTPEQFAALIKEDIVRWGQVVKQSGARID